MTDTSKRIESNGNTLFQLGFESLVPNDGKVYGLTKGNKGKNSVKDYYFESIMELQNQLQLNERGEG